MRIRYSADNPLRDWDAIDAEAEAQGAAIRTMRHEHGLRQTTKTRRQAKRGIVRGSRGAKGRTGLLPVPATNPAD